MRDEPQKKIGKNIW